MAKQTIMLRLSQYIAEAGGRLLPEAVLEKAKHHILDTIAAMVSGSRLMPGELAIKFIRLRRRPRAMPVDECANDTECFTY